MEESLIQFFERLESELEEQIEPQYFETPRRFSYLLEVIEILGKKIEQTDNNETDALLTLQNQNPAYNELLKKSEFILQSIEDIVKFQHGSLNNSVETMGDVITGYTKSRVEVSNLRESVEQIKTVLTSKKTGQTDLKKLWLQKTELEESIRMLNALELLKDAPMRVQHLTNQNRYLAAVNTLNTSVENMFDMVFTELIMNLIDSEQDFVEVEALSSVREQLLDLKGKLLERLAEELKDAAMGASPVFSWHSSLTSSTGPKSTAGRSIGGRSRSGLSFDDGNESVYQSDAGSSDSRNAPSEFSESRSMASRVTHRLPPSRSTSHPSTQIQNNAQWSTDLSEATEAMEASLSDPKSSGSLYIRLLVKAVSGLSCEEDAERMIFEGAADQFRRSIYRLKLNKREANTENQESSDIYSQDTYKKNISQFTQFVREMLETALNMLKMILYILKLLNHCKRGIAPSPGAQNPELKENIKKSIIQLWESAQMAIISELQRHFVEQAVEEMSDQVHKTRAESNLEDNELIAIRSTSPIGLLGVQDPENMNIENHFTVSQNLESYNLLSDRSMTILRDQVNSQLLSADVCKVQEAVQRTLETELMPLIQSEVNAEMRDLQTDSQLFMAPTGHSAAIPKEGDEADISEAAKRCSSIIQPLFSHWAELPQHRDQVLTILDRVIRGYASTAREEMEALSWKLISGVPSQRANVAESMKNDPAFTAYRFYMYDGWSSVDELFQAMTGAPATATTSLSFSSPGGLYTSMRKQNTQDLNDTILASLLNEFFTWGALWDPKGVGGITDGNDKIATDFSKLSTIAAIAHSCDRLVMNSAKLCRAALKLVSTHHHHTNRRTLAHLSSSADESALALWTSIQVWYSTIALHVRQGSAKSLSKLAEDCISILRGEMEVVSLTFLRQLVTLQMGAASSQTASLKSTSNKEILKGTSSKANTGQQQEGDSTIMTTLNHHIMSIQDAILISSSPSLLAVTLAPLCRLIPRFFTRSLSSLAAPEVTSTNISRLMKSVVASQQNLSLLLESSRLEPTTDRRLQDLLTDEFDRLRKFATLLQMRPVPEFQEYLRTHKDDFTNEEYSHIWSILRQRNDAQKLPTYEELLKQISSSRSSSSDYTSSPSPHEKKSIRRTSMTHSVR